MRPICSAARRPHGNGDSLGDGRSRFCRTYLGKRRGLFVLSGKDKVRVVATENRELFWPDSLNFKMA
jgi:hypothetical protein